jgi:quercetin dioxygenase-like cupin family protein
MKRGAVLALPAQSHISENTGKTPLKVIIVEFKKPAPAAAAAKKASSVPSCKPIAESAWATAQLCGGAAGSVTAKHTHAREAIYVALTDVTAEIDAGGKKRPMELKKDTAAIAAPETHSATNKGKTPYELIVIDLKYVGAAAQAMPVWAARQAITGPCGDRGPCGSSSPSGRRPP